MKSRALLFIGSSTEGLPLAKAAQSGMADFADVTIWTQGIFKPSYGYLESLTQALEAADFAVLILSPDDVTESRGVEIATPRDNVIFELGLFIGHLGRERCLFVHEKGAALKLPSDLLGISGATYHGRNDGNMRAALGPVCLEVETRIRELGLRARMLKLSAGAERGSGLPNLSGTWAGYSPEGSRPTEQLSTMTLEQYGSLVRATVVRTAKRVFEYEGRLTSGQLVLFFEDPKGRGYIVGTMVLHLGSDLQTLVGRSTYFDHAEGIVVSKARRYVRESLK
jgi:hypothetical protein